MFPAVDAAIRRVTLFRERYRVLMRRDHPAAAGFDLERWLAYPHVVVSGRGDARGALDEALARHGRSRRVSLVVPSFLMVPPLLRHSELIATLPSRCLPPGADAGFARFEPPVRVDGFPLHLAWHNRRDTDAGVRHITGIIREPLPDEAGS